MSRSKLSSIDLAVAFAAMVPMGLPRRARQYTPARSNDDAERLAAAEAKRQRKQAKRAAEAAHKSAAESLGAGKEQA